MDPHFMVGIATQSASMCLLRFFLDQFVHVVVVRIHNSQLSLDSGHMTHITEAYTSFCNMQRLGVLDGAPLDAVCSSITCRLTLSIFYVQSNSLLVLLNTPIVQEHTTVIPTGTQMQAIQSCLVPRSRYFATISPFQFTCSK